jgi:hypothetical protein
VSVLLVGELRQALHRHADCGRVALDVRLISVGEFRSSRVGFTGSGDFRSTPVKGHSQDRRASLNASRRHSIERGRAKSESYVSSSIQVCSPEAHFEHTDYFVILRCRDTAAWFLHKGHEGRLAELGTTDSRLFQNED